MKINLKYIALLLTICFLGMDQIHAQERRSSEESEIVMTQSELDSLLLKIRRYKQRELAKQRKYRQSDNVREYDSILAPKTKTTKSFAAPSENMDMQNQERIYNEFARLNNRIDWLILNMGNSNPQARTSYVPNSGSGSPSVVYIDPNSQTQKPFAPGIMGEQMMPDNANQEKSAKSTETTTIPQESYVSPESQKLQDEINDLNEQVRVLGKLGETTQSKEYDGEISELTERIENLKSELQESRKRADEERALREQSDRDRSSRVKGLRDMGFVVYFANNSTKLSSSDEMAVKKLAENLDGYDGDDYTVMLHGFASKSGSAAYNNKISFERAENVKRALRQNGINAKNIVVYPHGIDDSGKPEEARRVEVTLRAQ